MHFSYPKMKSKCHHYRLQEFVWPRDWVCASGRCVRTFARQTVVGWLPSPNLQGNHPTTIRRSNLRTHLPDAHTQSLGPDGFVESFMMTFRFNFRIIKIYCTWICESESTIGEIDNQLQNFINSLMFQPLILSSFSSFLYPPPPSPFPAFLYPLMRPLQRSQQQLALFDFPLKK